MRLPNGYERDVTARCLRLPFGECGTFRTLVATSPQVAMVGSQEERPVAE
jgi:hypothetical protein